MRNIDSYFEQYLFNQNTQKTSESVWPTTQCLPIVTDIEWENQWRSHYWVWAAEKFMCYHCKKERLYNTYAKENLS